MDLLPLSLIRNDVKSSKTPSSRTSSIDKRIERRKPNWTECENLFLLDQFSLHHEILTCKATDASTNLRKQEVWRIICHNLNVQNTVVRRTPAEVRRKWKNLVTAAKKEIWEMRHQSQINGSIRKISDLSQRVLQLHSSNALFHHNDDIKSNNNNDYEKLDYYNFTTPIIQLNENISSPTGSMTSTTESRNEFDSGIYEEAHDLRVNKPIIERKTSDSTTEELMNNSNQNNDLFRLKLELQIDVLRLRKRKLAMEVKQLRRRPGLVWRKRK